MWELGAVSEADLYLKSQLGSLLKVDVKGQGAEGDGAPVKGHYGMCGRGAQAWTRAVGGAG